MSPTKSRFGKEVPKKVEKATRNKRARKSQRNMQEYSWIQFKKFCNEKNYVLEEKWSEEKIAEILTDWALNMRKVDGTEYKEAVIKILWNCVAKELQFNYRKDYGIQFDPFKDIAFKKARDTRNAKRCQLRQLQKMTEERKRSAAYISSSTPQVYEEIVSIWDEDTPLGLQRKFYYVATVELEWNDEEASKCTVEDFQVENDTGCPNGRLLYKTALTKRMQENKPAFAVKLLIANTENSDLCPVRLFKKLVSKRSPRITTNRLFLTPSSRWKTKHYWYKNIPVARRMINRWTVEAATIIGVDATKVKFTNHALQSSAISYRVNSGMQAQETNVSKPADVQPRLLEEHPHTVEENGRNRLEKNTNAPSCENTADNPTTVITFKNCTFIINKSLML